VSVAKIGFAVDAPTREDYLEEGGKLFKAFESIGFVYISDHGLPEEAIKAAMEHSKDFFKLAKTEKDKFTKDETIQQGYVEPGREVFTDTTKDTLTEIRETYDVTRIEGKDAIFPDDIVPNMRPSLEDLIMKSTELTFRILRALALSLGLEQEYFVEREKDMFTDNCHSKLRSLHYPPITEAVTAGVVRCGEHTDYGLVTLLFQDSMGGLEVKGVDGKWIDATPIPGTILINAGDMLEIYTSGRLPATMHRVVVPEEEVQRRTARQSIVFFIHPDNDVPIHPLPGFENVNNLEKYREVTSLEHVLKRFAANAGYSSNGKK